MRRKLVQQGASTLMVSLPSKWAHKNKLGKGDEIEIEERGNDLLINTKIQAKHKREITIKITSENRKDLKNILTHAYRKGFDKIIIQDIDNELLKQIRKNIDLLLGFEITERDSKKCILENISEPLEQKYEIMLKKVFLNIKETQNQISEDLKTGKLNVSEAEEVKNQHDKFILFCRRLLSRQTEDNLEWELLTFLTHIQHTYYYLYKYIAENKIKGNKHILDLLEKTKDYFSLFEDAYFNQKIESIHKINNLKNEYHFGTCIKLIEKANGKDAVVYCEIKQIFRLIQIGTSPILAKILDKKNN